MMSLCFIIFTIFVFSSDHARLAAAEGRSHAHKGEEGRIAIGDRRLVALGS